MRASQLLKQERATLVGMLERLDADQWSAATLCAAWDVSDVVAHLLAREERPFGFVAGKLSKGWLGPDPDDLAEQIRARGRQAMLRGLRAGPPLVHGLPGPAAQINLIENWVHQEDIRRGELNQPRPTAPATQRFLWDALRLLPRLMLRTIALPGVVALEQPDGTSMAWRVGGGALPRQANARAAAVRLVGEPGELLLFLLGRKQAAQISFKGEGPLLDALLTARMEI